MKHLLFVCFNLLNEIKVELFISYFIHPQFTSTSIYYFPEIILLLIDTWHSNMK